MAKLPLGVAESLNWLSATPEELALLSALRGIFPSDFEATFKAVTGSLEQDHDFFFAAVADKLRKLFKSDGFISPEEMQKVGEGAHPFYSNGGTNQRERLALLLEDLISGAAAPERLHLKWEELLKLAEGDPFKAFILAEFERPQAEE